ncbi:MAG: hypothetical protein ACRD6W_11895, partial [Nitrososphaerales archaeon]
PLLVVGSVVGCIDLCKRLRARRRLGIGVVGGVALLALFGVIANLAMSSTPTGWWSESQARRFVDAEKSIGDLTGQHPLVVTTPGDRLPKTAPLNELYATGDCGALWIYPSTGYLNWELVARSPGRPNALCKSLVDRSRQHDADSLSGS